VAVGRNHRDRAVIGSSPAQLSPVRLLNEKKSAKAIAKWERQQKKLRRLESLVRNTPTAAVTGGADSRSTSNRPWAAARARVMTGR
jgi:hypothetical protein